MERSLADLAKEYNAGKDTAQGQFTQSLSALAQGLRHMFATPGDVAAGKYTVKPEVPGQWSEADEFRQQHALGKMMDWGHSTALGMMGTGAPMAQSGAAGVFGGKLAKTADHAALARAEELAASGAGREKIWAETGWFQGPDQKWRFEIPDAKSQLNPNTYQSGLPATGRPSLIGGEIWHPELYAAYPEMRKARIRIKQGNNSGRYFPESGTGDVPVIHVNATNPATARSVGLHEIQHDIQAREGFAKGADFERVGMENYVKSAGEVEAANVQRRLFMTPEELRATPPWQTERIPADQQIVNMGYRGPSAMSLQDLAMRYAGASAAP